MDILHEKLALLMENIKAMGSVAVAFSGGVDSTFLMKAAHKALGDKAVAVTARSHCHSEREWKEAEELAKAEGIRHVMFDFPECDLKEFAQNRRIAATIVKQSSCGECGKWRSRKA